ncbi:AI-2E family transporter [Roseinatronobacter sp. S2]|uniref:AI-2E family transporter n=1 Tax=Roseinatronobacter sp. S2 TaxID=3035471 RepID=UPI00240F7313|nr:AI-2E family transporter [Roseinatronobacter sp. S2]WFE74313.1 AI-2E family transporter [Roseinatronobacter sp. S2]
MPLSHSRSGKAPVPALAKVEGSPRASMVLTGIFIILVLGAVHYARDFLLPVVTAVLLFFVFMPLQRRLLGVGLPGTPVAAGLVLGLMAGIAAVFVLLSGPVMQLADNMPDIVRDITRRLTAIQGAMLNLMNTLGESEQGFVPDLRATEALQDADDGGGADFLLTTASGALTYLAEAPAKVAQVLFMLILLFFLLSSSELIYLKIVQSFGAFSDKRIAINTLHKIEHDLGGYLGTVAFINAGLGVCVGLAMWALGMPVPLLFAVLAFTLNFIPYLGAVTGVVLTSMVAILWFDDLRSVLMVTLAYFTLTSLEGQLITPHMLARRLRMNRVLVFLSVAFWAWMWSFLGMLIAVPLLVMVRVILEQFPGAAKVANLLSDDTQPRVPAPPQ